MNEPVVTPTLRHPAGSVSRRVSLTTLAGTGIAALVGGTLAASAKKKKKNKKKKDPFARCKPQVQQCEIALAGLGVQPQQLVCCQQLATCDMQGHLDCLRATTPP